MISGRLSARSALALLVAALVVLVAQIALLGAPARAATTLPWNLQQIKLSATEDFGKSGEGVTVAVVDSWVDGGHPDFQGRVLAGASCLSGTCVAGAQRRDDCGHGTHVAGTIASNRFGVAPRAKILPVQVVRWVGSAGACGGSEASEVAGIDWAVQHGAQVINLSLGGEMPGLFQSPAITDAIHRAAGRGVVVVVAAGNSELPISDDYGGDALVVAATGPNGQLAYYSQRGPRISVAAPGGAAADNGRAECTRDTCVLSTWPDNRFAVSEGTSMATPHVAGLAALLIAQDPKRGRADTVRAITSTATPLTQAGHGLINASAALALRAPKTTAAAPPPAAAAEPAPPLRPAPPPRPAPQEPIPAPLVINDPSGFYPALGGTRQAAPATADAPAAVAPAQGAPAANSGTAAPASSSDAPHVPVLAVVALILAAPLIALLLLLPTMRRARSPGRR